MSWLCLSAQWSVLTWIRRRYRIRLSFININYSLMNGFSLLLVQMNVSRVSQHICVSTHPTDDILWRHSLNHSSPFQAVFHTQAGSCSLYYRVRLGRWFSRVNKLDCTDLQINCHSGACLKQILQWESPGLCCYLHKRCDLQRSTTAPLNLHTTYLIWINVAKYAGTLKKHIMLS